MKTKKQELIGMPPDEHRKTKSLKIKKLGFTGFSIHQGGFHCDKTSGVIDVCCMINTDICWKV